VYIGRCCPYFLTRAAAKDHADIIFMPYNYLIDARVSFLELSFSVRCIINLV